MSINRVNITGNLTRDPELRASAGGTQILRLGVAVNDRRRNPQTDQWEDVPNYIDCVVFGRRAESLSRFLSKGSKVAIEGKLRWSQWQDRETGKNRSKIEVVVDDLEFMSSNRQGDGGQAQGSYQPQGGYPQQGYQSQGGYPAQQPQGYVPAAAQGQQAAPAAQTPPPVAQTPPPPAEDLSSEDIPF